jgi:hypothetical protein
MNLKVYINQMKVDIYSFFVGLICTGIADMFWALYTKAITKHIPLKAAMWSSCLILIGIIDLYIFIRYPLPNGIGSIIGAFLGTYFTLKWMPDAEA